MAIAIGDDHVALENAARKFLESKCPPAVVRATLEAPDEVLPPFWSALVDLGWLGLHVAEADGGQGYGLIELAVVLEAMGRACAPGPFLPSALAAALTAGTPVAGLIAAGAPATVAFGGLDAPVWCAGLAEWFVVPSSSGKWEVFAKDAVTVSPLGSLDPTRRLWSVTLAPGASPAHVLSVSGVEVRALVATLLSAEAAGIGGWCVDTAADYARVRQQFGRPIGQFQAVKHRCADMLVAVEQARSLAWDAAQASDDVVAVCAAGAIAPDAAVKAAKDCIQVLGGMGFTWEHDAHVYLRRAMSVRQLVGGASSWRAELASAALDGARRHLSLDLGTSVDDFRASVRGFVASLAGLSKEEQRARVVEAGYFTPHWPEPWGLNATAAQQLVIDEEFAAARIRRPNLAVGAWAAPTIVAHGTLEQQDRWVGPTLRGEISWCQLFSEPGAGSDLASLTTAATRVEGGWRINGQKVWTTMAREADWGILLARSNPDVAKHLGITYFIVDMKSPGIEVRPLRELTGLAMFNEVFFTDLFVPDDCVIGEVDGGWPLARTTLANERVAMGNGSSFGGGIEALLAFVSGRPPLSPTETDQLGALLAEAQSVALLGLRSTHRSLAGAKPGPEASVRKLLGVEHDQRTQEFGLALLGADGATTEGVAQQWTFGFLANRCLTIAGGTSEIQRNVIGERLLGLPRDPA